MEENVKTIDPERARKLVASGEAQALDLRGDEAWRESHVPGAVHADPDDVESHADELKRGGAVVVIAEDEDSGRKAAQALSGHDLDVAVLDGGMDAWDDEDFKTEPSSDPDEDAPVEPDAAR
jgi:rhodanese-related sulfurtransferase